jgi:hypothetical protein
MSGYPATDSQGKPLLFSDGTAPEHVTSGQSYVTTTRSQGFCFDPAVDPIPPDDNPPIVNTPLGLVNSYYYQVPNTTTIIPGYGYTLCGVANCNREYSSMQAVDPQAHGRQCTPFTFRGGTAGSYCYNSGVDPNPWEGESLCGDFWMKGVTLGTDWQLIKVPFASLLQQGWAKRSYQIDLSSLTDVRLEWDRGWIDYWISDVRFYRTKAQ